MKGIESLLLLPSLLKPVKKPSTDWFVEFEPLPAVFEIEDALKKEAPLLHPEIAQTNIFKKMEARKGEVEKGFAESEYVFEGEYHTPDVQHVAMEPASCICHYCSDGTLTVWSNTQTPFQDRRLLAELLDLPESRVRVIKPVDGRGVRGQATAPQPACRSPALKAGQKACQNHQHP